MLTLENNKDVRSSIIMTLTVWFCIFNSIDHFGCFASKSILIFDGRQLTESSTTISPLKMLNSQNSLVEQGVPRFLSRYFNVIIVGY
jgi:hypothetical protein